MLGEGILRPEKKIMGLAGGQEPISVDLGVVKWKILQKSSKFQHFVGFRRCPRVASFGPYRPPPGGGSAGGGEICDSHFSAFFRIFRIFPHFSAFFRIFPHFSAFFPHFFG